MFVALHFFSSHNWTNRVQKVRPPPGSGSQLLVGTTRNTILAGNLELSFREVVLGHADEVSRDALCTLYSVYRGGVMEYTEMSSWATPTRWAELPCVHCVVYTVYSDGVMEYTERSSWATPTRWAELPYSDVVMEYTVHREVVLGHADEVSRAALCTMMGSWRTHKCRLIYVVFFHQQNQINSYSFTAWFVKFLVLQLKARFCKE